MPQDQAADPDYKLRLDEIQIKALQKAVDMAISVKSGDFDPVIAIYGCHSLSDDDLKAPREFLLWAQRLLVPGKEREHEWPESMVGHVKELGGLRDRLQGLSGTGEEPLVFGQWELHRLIEATDLYFRLLMGQTTPLIDTFRFAGHIRSPQQLGTAESALKKMHTLLTSMPPDGSHGIHSPKVDDTARVLYDIHQVLQHHVAIERNMDLSSGWRRSPVRSSKSTDIPELVVNSAPEPAEASEASPRI